MAAAEGVANLGEILADAIHDDEGLIGVGVRQDDEEFLAAIAAQDVVLAQALLQQPRQAADDLVADRVAVAVVDFLEVVYVHHHHGQESAFVSEAGKQHVQGVLAAGVVEQAGQAVVVHGAPQGAVTLDLALDDGVEEHRVERLGEEVITAQAHGVDLERDVGLARQIDDGRTEEFAVLADDARSLHAGAVRHVHVHQDQVRIELAQGVEHLARIVDDFRSNLVFLEGAPDQVAGGLGVLDDEHAIGFLFLPLVEFHDAFDDTVQRGAFQQAAVAAAAQRLLQGFEFRGHADADKLAHGVALAQDLDAFTPFRHRQAGEIEQQQRRAAGVLRQRAVPGEECGADAEVAQLREQCQPRFGIVSDQPGVGDFERAACARRDLHAPLDAAGGGIRMGAGHLRQRGDALIEVLQFVPRQGVGDLFVEARQRHLFELVAGVVQGGHPLVDEEFGEAVDRHRQLDEALEAGCGAIARPGLGDGLIPLDEFFGRAEHVRSARRNEKGCARLRASRAGGTTGHWKFGRTRLVFFGS